jgi:hypothetical protein
MLTKLRSGSRSNRSALWLLVALATLVAVLGTACGGGEATAELESDPNDAPAEGPLPTAPVERSGNEDEDGSTGFSGNVDVNDLILRIDALNEEDDLCVLLTGEAMGDITGSDINLTSLMSNPAGFTQLFAALEKVFGHMIEIASDDLRPALTQMQTVWSGMATIDPRAADAEAQAKALIESPDVQAAQDGLAAWVLGNCQEEATS